MIKKLISAAAAMIIAITGIGTMKTTAEVIPNKKSPIIYRTSHEGRNIKGEFTFTYALIARENGNIHIDIQANNCSPENPRVSGSRIGEIGNLSFNDNMIAAVGEDGASGTSFFKQGNSTILSSFDNERITYTIFDSEYCDSGDIGRTITYFDLYVKEDYLNINQTIDFFGEEVCIPFGKDLITDDTDSLKARIAELEVENVNLKVELEAVNKRLEDASVLIDQTTNGDINGDGYTNAADASVILGYYSYLSTGGTITLKNYMLAEGIV